MTEQKKLSGIDAKIAKQREQLEKTLMKKALAEHVENERKRKAEMALERRNRTRRLIRNGALFEPIHEQMDALTKEQKDMLVELLPKLVDRVVKQPPKPVTPAVNVTDTQRTNGEPGDGKK